MAAEIYGTGTIAVTQGQKIVTLTGGAWLEGWAVPGNQVVIAGENQVNFVRSWISTTQVELVLPVARTTNSALAYSMLITAPAFGTNRQGAMTNIERIRLMTENAELAGLFGVGAGALVAPALDDRLAGWDTSNGNAVVPFALEAFLRAGARVASKSTDYTVQSVGANSDFGSLILMSAGTGERVIPLPAAATAGAGFVVGIKKTDSSANAVTIDPSGAETIDGDPILALQVKNSVVWLRCDGTGWQVLSNGGGNLASEANIDGTGGNWLSYFTAAGAKARTAFTAFARALLDDPDAATMRATLGANNAANLTAGEAPYARMPRAIALSAGASTTTDFNTLVEPGWAPSIYEIPTCPNSPPGPSGQYCHVFNVAYAGSVTLTQYAIPYAGTLRTKLYPTFYRTAYLGTWSGWGVQSTPIIGSVAQVGGVPTGALMERGTVGSGEYIRYADGTQICRGVISSGATTGTIVYPAAFSSPPSNPGGTNFNANSVTDFWGIWTTSTASQFTYRWSTRSDVTGYYIAIGRWF